MIVISNMDKYRTDDMNSGSDAEDVSGYLLPLQKCLAGDHIKTLSDQELLALIIGSGTRNAGVMDIAHGIIRKFGGLPGLAAAGTRELARSHGIGPVKAIRILSAFDMGRRVITRPREVRHIDSPGAVWKFLIPHMARLEQEEFRVLVLNNKNNLLKNAVISLGTVSEAIVHPREVFRDAIRESGAAVIVAHNHPTGETEPSKEDIAATRRLSEAGKIVGIPVLDHVIITNSGYFSFKEGGYL